MGTNAPYNALLILASLADADRHGYAIKKDIVERSGGQTTLGSTTLYRLLGQLLDRGLIEEAKSRPAPQLDDERRRYFHITAAGRRELASETRRLERVLLAARPALSSRGR
jgi:DNA-binding PadR family transcriptional regulator